LPVVDDIDTGGYWAAAALGRLVVRACRNCAVVLHLPQAHCHACGSWDTYWREIAPLGTLYSWTVSHQQLHPAFPAPYTIVLIDLDDAPGAHLVGYLEGAPKLHAGMAFHALFDEVAPGVRLVQWRPAP